MEKNFTTAFNSFFKQNSFNTKKSSRNEKIIPVILFGKCFFSNSNIFIFYIVTDFQAETKEKNCLKMKQPNIHVGLNLSCITWVALKTLTRHFFTITHVTIPLETML